MLYYYMVSCPQAEQGTNQESSITCIHTFSLLVHYTLIAALGPLPGPEHMLSQTVGLAQK